MLPDSIMEQLCCLERRVSILEELLEIESDPLTQLEKDNPCLRFQKLSDRVSVIESLIEEE